MCFCKHIEALSIGASMVDGTVMGMGRGAGNSSLEGLLGFLKNPKYEIAPVLSFIEKHMLKLIEDGAVWGYNIPYPADRSDGSASENGHCSNKRS